MRQIILFSFFVSHFSVNLPPWMTLELQARQKIPCIPAAGQPSGHLEVRASILRPQLLRSTRSEKTARDSWRCWRREEKKMRWCLRRSRAWDARQVGFGLVPAANASLPFCSSAADSAVGVSRMIDIPLGGSEKTYLVFGRQSEFSVWLWRRCLWHVSSATFFLSHKKVVFEGI